MHLPAKIYKIKYIFFCIKCIYMSLLAAIEESEITYYLQNAAPVDCV